MLQNLIYVTFYQNQLDQDAEFEPSEKSSNDLKSIEQRPYI